MAVEEIAEFHVIVPRIRNPPCHIRMTRGNWLVIGQDLDYHAPISSTNKVLLPPTLGKSSGLSGAFLSTTFRKRTRTGGKIISGRYTSQMGAVHKNELKTKITTLINQKEEIKNSIDFLIYGF